MAEFTQEDIATAERIINAIIEGKIDANDLSDNLSIIDIERDTKDFYLDLEFLRYIGNRLPAVRFKNELVIPVALSLLFPSRTYFTQFGSRRSFEEYSYFFRDRYFNSLENEGYMFLSNEEAQAIYKRRVISFLASRIAGLRSIRERQANVKNVQLNMQQNLNGPRIPTPGCVFSVTANSPGLRVFWSGAYRLQSNYFGHPTSPIQGTLQSGDYVFGVDGGAYGNIIQWDRNALITLPGNTVSVHLLF